VAGTVNYQTFTSFVSRPGWLILEEYNNKKMKSEISNQPPRPQTKFGISTSALYCGHPSFKMRVILSRIVILFSLLIIPVLAVCQAKKENGIYADFITNKGTITVKLDYIRTPMTVANFIGLAEGTITNSTYPLGKSFFDGSIWHRVVKGHVIQGGEPAVVKDPATFEGNSIGYEIPNEITDLSHNKAGMLGMANGGPHTNTCEYYITLADRSYLDGNYTLFGEVFEGMDVVNKIEKGDTTFSIIITRVGPEAKKFLVNDDTFRKLVFEQWKKVNTEKQKKDDEEAKYISENLPDLITLPDSLRYKILLEGSGDKPSDGSEVTVSYTGRLINGLTFSSSADDGKPVAGSEQVNFRHTLGKPGLIKGLEEAIRDMKTGEKRILVIPTALAYGKNNAYYSKELPGKKRLVISPGETLIVEVTLIKFDLIVR
jgi:cyclophilin family peptidyl-prolyl cis-trans isomerase